MELIKPGLPSRVKAFILRINEDNLFLLASSISYYSAVAIAPFLLILLGVASLVGENIQQKLSAQAYSFSPEFGRVVELIFTNVNQGINLGTISGWIGLGVLFFTASLVFLQLRYSLDVIWGHHGRRGLKSLWETILEKLFAILVVAIAGVFLVLSSSLPGLLRLYLNEGYAYHVPAVVLNFFIYVVMFWGIHFFAPSKRPAKFDALKISVLSSVFFIVGNILLGIYFREVATSSIYGAAASLLIFLIWTYYSSFTLFLSVELFLFLKRHRRIK